jgi:hypothetical protein
VIFWCIPNKIKKWLFVIKLSDTAKNIWNLMCIWCWRLSDANQFTKLQISFFLERESCRQPLFVISGKKKCLSGYQITKVHLSYKISNNYKYSISKCLSHLVIFPISINKEIKSNDTKFKIWLKLIKFTCWTVRRFTILTPKQKIRASHPLNEILLIPSFTNGVT